MWPEALNTLLQPELSFTSEKCNLRGAFRRSFIAVHWAIRLNEGTHMALPRITQKEMTEREQRELKTLLDRARIAHGRLLTNAETNSVKKEYIDKLMVQREAEAKKARQVKKKQAYKPDTEASFSWSASTPTRGRR